MYLDPRWVADQAPVADFAIARVSRPQGDAVERAVGSGFVLGKAPPEGTEVAVSGYALGVGGGQLGCRARATTERGFPALPCAGLVDGTSGAPWVVGAAPAATSEPGAAPAATSEPGAAPGATSVPGAAPGATSVPGAAPAVTGIVGGLDGGGCEEDVSYSPPFDDAIKQLLRRAEAGGAGDVAPAAFAGEC